MISNISQRMFSKSYLFGMIFTPSQSVRIPTYNGSQNFRSKLPPIWTDRLFGNVWSRLRHWQSTVRLMFNDTSTPSIHNISYMMIVYNDCYNNICTLLYNLMHLLWHNLYLYASAMYMQNIMKMSNIYLCAHYIHNGWTYIENMSNILHTHRILLIVSAHVWLIVVFGCSFDFYAYVSCQHFVL